MMGFLREPFMQAALAAGVVSAVLCAYLGVFVLMKRVVFITVALSEVAALGIAAGFAAGVHPVAASVVLTVAATVLFWHAGRSRLSFREAGIGAAYVLAAAGTILVLARNPAVEALGLDLMSGNILYALWPDVRLLATVAMAIAAVHVLFRREFVFLSLDPDTAAAAGVPVAWLDLVLYLTIGVVISATMKVAGVLLVFASLVLPPLVGAAVGRRTPVIFAVSGAVAAACVTAGLALSYGWDMPSGPTIVVLYGVVLGLTVVARKFLSR